MLKTKFNRHTIAFMTIMLASIFMYPFAQARFVMQSVALLVLIILAALLTLTTK